MVISVKIEPQELQREIFFNINGAGKALQNILKGYKKKDKSTK